MTISFQLAIFEASVDGSLSPDAARDIFSGVMSEMLPDFGLRSLGSVTLEQPPNEELPKWKSKWHPPPLPVMVPTLQRITDIASLLCHCQLLGLDQHLSALISKLATEAKMTGVGDFPSTFLPFLKALGASLRKWNIEVQHSAFQGLFQHVMSTYIERYIQQPPPIFKDWTRETVTCKPDCKDCEKLNEFLANPHKQAADFLGGASRRDHLQAQVAGTGIEAEQRRKYASGSAYALFLTKNQRYIEIGRKAWEKRGEETRNSFRDIESEANLKALLGDAYAAIISGTLPEQRAMHYVPPLGTSANTANRLPLPGLRGIKRKDVEMIVIDD